MNIYLVINIVINIESNLYQKKNLLDKVLFEF